MKTCYKCKIEKSIIYFYKAKSKKDGLQSKCKDCEKSYNLNIRDKIKTSATTKNWKLSNPDKVKADNKAWGLANPDKVKAKYKKYQQATLDKGAAKTHKRRALKLNSGGTYAVKDIRLLIETQQSKCVYCKVELILEGKGKYHIDHIMPLFLGGTNYPINLQALCPSCNMRKGKQHPDDYEKKVNPKMLEEVK